MAYTNRGAVWEVGGNSAAAKTFAAAAIQCGPHSDRER